ncbi:MAG: DUF4367 domain-containing protein [Patescibacteria group bacterium]|nr:DUF4367 domain-containing protein [Patescibacteria group bacterium]
MYCNHCGQDEPEIKLNGKDYCSNCGLPLFEKEVAKDLTKESTAPKEEKNELSTAFNQMNSILGEKSGGFYRSGDARIIPRVVKTKKKEEEKVETEEITEVQIEKPIQNQIENDLSLKEGVEIPEIKEEPSINLPPLKPIVEQKKEELQPTDLKAEEIQELVSETSPSIKMSVQTEEKTEQFKIDKDLLPTPFEEETEEENLEPEVLEAAKDALEETEKDQKSQGFSQSVETIDALGDTGRLIDILGDESKENEFLRKKENVRKTGNVFTKLIDILNQPVESPKPVKVPPKAKKGSNDNTIEEAIDALNSQKEITSPLDEIEIPSVLNENITKVLEENKIPKISLKPKSKKIKSKKIKKEDKISTIEEGTPNIEKLIFENPEEEQEKNIGAEINKPLEEYEPQKEVIASENIKQTVPEEESSKPLSTKELKAIQKEIHALGEKKDHDKWPEEEVVRFDNSEEQEEKPDFFKDYVSSLLSPEKEKKKKRKSNLMQGLKILASFAFSIIIIYGVYYLFTIQSKSEKTEVAEEKSQFNAKLPSYLTPGYEKDKVTSSADIYTINYKYLPDSKRQLIIIEQNIRENALILENYSKENSKTYSLNKLKGIDYYILDDKEVTWIKDNVWYIVRRSGELSIEELKKVAESIQ